MWSDRFVGLALSQCMDCGDNVIIVNAEKVQLTGNKRADKTYYRQPWPIRVRVTVTSRQRSIPFSSSALRKA